MKLRILLSIQHQLRSHKLYYNMEFLWTCMRYCDIIVCVSCAYVLIYVIMWFVNVQVYVKPLNVE